MAERPARVLGTTARAGLVVTAASLTRKLEERKPADGARLKAVADPNACATRKTTWSSLDLCAQPDVPQRKHVAFCMERAGPEEHGCARTLGRKAVQGLVT